MLLQVYKYCKNKNIDIELFGQEKNSTTFDLCRMNMLLHGVNFSNFNITHGDTLLEPDESHMDKKYDIVVSNPPYSISWNPEKLDFDNDKRFAEAGVLAPKGFADFAFVLHALYLLSAKGKAAIVCFPGIFYRKGVEQKIRKYLIDNNFIDCIIDLPENLFFGTSISTTILILSKNKSDTNILFISAKNLYYKKDTKNELDENSISSILDVYNNRKNSDISELVNNEIIKENKYDLSVNKYIKTNDENDEAIDINILNNEINILSDKNIKLRQEINQIIKEIENE